MRALAAALLALSALPAFGFDWGEVPGAVHVTPVRGRLEASGIPVRALTLVSKASPEELARHFAQLFESSGLYVPPPSHQVRVKGAFQLAALDVDKLVAYTAMFRPNNDGTVTVILGEGDVSSPRPQDASGIAPLFPGAVKVLTSDVEQARLLSYEAFAREEEIAQFYRETLGRSGYVEEDPGTFRHEGNEFQVMTRQVKGGARQVVVVSRTGRAR